MEDMAAGFSSTREATRGIPLDYHLFPFGGADTSGLPALKFPGIIVLAPSEESLDVTWNSADYARALPRLCSARILGLGVEVAENSDLTCTVQLATEDTCVVWRIYNSTKIPYDLDLLLSGPIPKVGRNVVKRLRALETAFKTKTCNFCDIDLSLHLLGLPPADISVCASFLGFSVPKINGPCEWRAPVLSEVQLSIAATHAWSSLLICLVLLREEKGKQFLQTYPFLHSCRELDAYQEMERRARTSTSAALQESLRVVNLAEVPEVIIARVANQSTSSAHSLQPDELDPGLTTELIHPDLWTVTHEWTNSSHRKTSPFVIHSSTVAVTLVAQFLNDESWVVHTRPGLVSALQVRAQRHDSGRSDVCRRHWRQHGRAMADLLEHVYTSSAHSLSQSKVTSTVVVPVGDDRCDSAVSNVLSDLSIRNPNDHDVIHAHLGLHTRRLQEYLRLALRLNVAPFVLVTATSVASGGDHGGLVKFDKRPPPCDYSHKLLAKPSQRR